MSAVTSWLDHDFPLELEPTPAGWMHVGTILDVDVYTPTHLDPASPACVGSDAAPGDTLRGGGQSSPGAAVDQRKAALIAELLDLVITKPSQWHSFILGHVRRNRAATLDELPVDALLAVVRQAEYLARGKPSR